MGAKSEVFSWFRRSSAAVTVTMSYKSRYGLYHNSCSCCCRRMLFTISIDDFLNVSFQVFEC